MRIGIGINIGGGEARDTTPPVISSESYNTGTNILTANVSEAGVAYGLWSQTGGKSAATIRTEALTPVAFSNYGYYVSGTTTPITVDDSALTAGTWYFQWCVYDFAGNGALGTQQSKVVANTKTETWSLYSAGNGKTELGAGALPYTFSAAGMTASVVTDTEGAAGIGVDIGISSGTVEFMYRADVSTYLAAYVAGTDVVQVLAKVRLLTTSTSERAAIGRFASSVNTGARISRTGVNANSLAIQSVGDIATPTNFTTVVTGQADGAASPSQTGVWWIRFEVNGTANRMKAWLASAGGPGSAGETAAGWVNNVAAGANLAFENLCLTARAANPATRVLGYSVALNATAPTF